MKIALAQISPKLKRNLSLHIEKIESVIEKASLILFPELSLNGYLLKDSVYEDAFSINELSIFKDYSQKIDIIVGVALKEGHKIYNSSIYFSKGEIKHIHRKNHLPNYGMFQESRFYFAGDKIEVFEVDNRKIITIVCEDLWSSKIIDKISEYKPDIVYVLANSPARGFYKDGFQIEEKWNSLLATTSILSGAYTIFCNRVGFEDGLGFWGGSRVIEPNGKIALKAKLFEEEILFAKLDHKLSYTEKYLLRIE